MSAAPLVLTTKGLDDYALLDSGHGRKLERFGGSAARPAGGAGDLDAAAFAERMGEGRRHLHRRCGRGRRRALEAARRRSRSVDLPARSNPLRLPLHVVPPCRRVSRAGGALVVHARAARARRANARRSSTSSATPGSPRSSRRRPAPRSRMSMPRRRRSPGRARTRRCPGWRTGRSAGSSTTRQKFAAREVRRGRRYDGILLDPPKFGRGPKGEVWDLFANLPEMLTLCRELAEARRLSDPHRLRDPRVVPVAASAVGGGARAGRRIRRARCSRTRAAACSPPRSSPAGPRR